MTTKSSFTDAIIRNKFLRIKRFHLKRRIIKNYFKLSFLYSMESAWPSMLRTFVFTYIDAMSDLYCLAFSTVFISKLLSRQNNNYERLCKNSAECCP